MIERITSILRDLCVSDYLITETSKTSSELFFIRKSLDMKRITDSHSYEVTVYNDFKRGDQPMRGFSPVHIYTGMTDEEIRSSLSSAYLAAGFVCNPAYKLPEAATSPCIDMDTDIASVSPEEACRIMSEALFAEDNGTDVFINSAELFVTNKTVRILTSAGTDVSFRNWDVNGEFVAQCITPKDVETYDSFKYTSLNAEGLRSKVRKILGYTAARAQAVTPPPAGRYRVILSDKYMKEFFSFFTKRTASGIKYAGYAPYNIGDDIQCGSFDPSEAPIKAAGDLISITLTASDPFSNEGIRMTDRPLLEDGILRTIHGNSRFAQYLGIEPTGDYQDFSVRPGKTSFDDMKKQPYLHVVNFSDFQMDPFGGHFGGEIRLAFLFDGDKVTPVTGGSVNGSIFDARGNLFLSSETIDEDGYRGPMAVCIPDIPVAGM